MKIELTLLLTFAGLIVGGFIGAIMRARASGSKFANAEREAAQIVESAKKEAETIVKEADIQSKDVVFKAKAAWDDEVREIRRELHAQEKRLVQKEENLDRKVSQADEKEHDLSRREQSLLDRDRNLQKRTEEAEALVAEQRLKLENLSGITAEEAKQQLMASMESEARHDAAKRIRQIEDEAKEVEITFSDKAGGEFYKQVQDAIDEGDEQPFFDFSHMPADWKVPEESSTKTAKDDDAKLVAV